MNAPVVHEDVSKYPLSGLLGGHWPANSTAAAIAIGVFVVRWSANDERHLQLEIKQLVGQYLLPFLGLAGSIMT
jgi:hypothetical protein